MEAAYRKAMLQLKNMFPDFDTESIKEVMNWNRGRLESTIDDIIELTLRINKSLEEDDNIFAEPQPYHQRFLWIFRDFKTAKFKPESPKVVPKAKKQEEDQSLKLAKELQRQYDVEASVIMNREPERDVVQEKKSPVAELVAERKSPSTGSGKKGGFFKKFKATVGSVFSWKTKKSPNNSESPKRKKAKHEEDDSYEERKGNKNNKDQEESEEEEEEEDDELSFVEDEDNTGSEETEKSESSEEAETKVELAKRSMRPGYKGSDPFHNIQIENIGFS